MSQFLGEIVPLAIDRLVVSPLATDLDTHLEVTMVYYDKLADEL